MKRYLGAALVMVGVMITVGGAGLWGAGARTAHSAPSTVEVNALQPTWDQGVFSAYVGPPSYPYVSPGATAVYLGRGAGIIKAGLAVDPTSGNYEDEGLFAFKPNVTIDSLASSPLTYDVVKQYGTNPVWMTIEIDTGLTGESNRGDNTVYQMVPAPYGSIAYTTVNAATGTWAQWTTPTSGVLTGWTGTLADVATANTGLQVVRTYLRLGMGNSYGPGPDGTQAWVDKASIGGVTYDFVTQCATTCYVDAATGNDSYSGDAPGWAKKTIQAAVNQVSAGGTVHVAAGTYVEQVAVNKNLTLTGSGAATSIIQAPGVLTNDPDGAKTVVLFTGSITAAFSGFTVQGPVNGINFGIYVRAGATANIHDNIIKDIRDNPLSGAQTGVAIEVGKTPDTAPFVSQTGTATITNSAISGYQKTGIAVENTGSSATITGNTITGAGPITTTAQNGIQIRRGAIATITTNTVTGNAYDGPTYSAEGIGALHAGTGVVIQGNTVNHNSANIYAWKSDGIQVLNNDVSDSAPVDQNASAGITVQSDGPSCCGGATGAYITGVTISGNTIQNNLSGGSSQGDGIDIYDVNGGTVSGNTITGAAHDGVLIGGSGNIAFTNNQFSGNGLAFADPNAAGIDFGGQPSGNGGPNPLGGFTAHSNSFIGNRNGIWNYDAASVNATDNWWGSANGPQHASNTFNVGSQGDKTSDNVTFVPWLNAAPPTGVSFAPVTTTSPVGSYSSIQAGVNASASGGTVNAVAGTFTENVTIGTPLTLAGAGQASTTVIPAVTNPNCGGGGGGSLCAGGSNIILTQANDVTIHDMTLDGNNPAITSGTSAGGSDLDARNGIIENYPTSGLPNAGVFNNLTVHHVTVKNIYLRGMYASSGGTGFNFHDDTVQNVQADAGSIAMFNYGGAGTMSNNTVADANDAISANHSRGTQFLNNVVTNSASGVHTDNAGDGGGVADLIDNNSVSSCATNGWGVWTFVVYIQPTVKRNVVTNCAVGMATTGSYAGVGTLFQDNEVDGGGLPGSTGLYITTSTFWWASANVSATLTGNVIKNNADGAFYQSEAGFTLTVDNLGNAIYGNSGTGASKDGTGTFNVKMLGDWWGSDTGPANATSNPSGTGNSVADGIAFSPWLGIGTDASVAVGFQKASPMTWIAGPAVCDGTCIQKAIDFSSNGDTVKATSGVFHENVTITKQLTLEGAGQAATTVEPAVSIPNPCAGSSLCGSPTAASNIILVQASNVTIHDMTLDGNNPAITSSISAGGSDLDARNGIVENYYAGVFNNTTVHDVTVKNIYLRGIYMSSGGSGFNLHHNTVQNVQADPASIGMFNWVGSGVMSDNSVSGANDAIAANHSSGTQFLRNTVTNSGSGVHTDNAGDGGGVADLIKDNVVTNSTYGVWVFVPHIAPTLQSNTITNVDVGLAAFGQGAPVTSSFIGNTVDGQLKPGSTGAYVTTDQLGYGFANSAASFTGNRVVNNVDGFYFDASLGGVVNVTAAQNCIVGNTNSGMTAAASVTAVNAENNWWGRVNGPAPTGSGDAISPPSTIDAVPFLTAPTASCASSLLVAGYPSPSVATVAHTFTVTAKDGSGNTDTMYTGTVHFTSSEYSAALPGDYTFVAGDAGTHTFIATMNLPVLHSLTATDTVSGITGTQSGIVVTLLDTDNDGCSDVYELGLVPPTNGLDPWDFYSVPVPALIAAPNPLVVFRDSAVGAGDAQAVFAYYKAGAKAGKPVYEQDLNNNGIKDGIEYDRSVLGPGHSGPPDGFVGAAEAQVAFAQYKLGYHCNY